MGNNSAVKSYGFNKHGHNAAGDIDKDLFPKQDKQRIRL